MTAKRRRKLREDFFLKQLGNCALCGEKMSPLDIAQDDLDNPGQYATLDHILPVSKGGTNRTSNLQLAHNKCNNEKGDTYIEMDQKA